MNRSLRQRGKVMKKEGNGREIKKKKKPNIYGGPTLCQVFCYLLYIH